MFIAVNLALVWVLILIFFSDVFYKSAWRPEFLNFFIRLSFPQVFCVLARSKILFRLVATSREYGVTMPTRTLTDQQIEMEIEDLAKEVQQLAQDIPPQQQICYDQFQATWQSHEPAIQALLADAKAHPKKQASDYQQAQHLILGLAKALLNYNKCLRISHTKFTP